MKMGRNREGSALVLAMLILLIFMGLTMNMLMDARSQNMLNAGNKLNQMYNMAALSVLNEFRADLPDFWIAPDTYNSAAPHEYRFGDFLLNGNPAVSSPDNTTPYGVQVAEDNGNFKMNAGMIELTYKIFAKNNPDDPAFMLSGMQTAAVSNPVVSDAWDFDGRIVLTAQVFKNGDPNPVAIHAMLVGPTGAEIIERHGEAQQETGAATENTGFRTGPTLELNTN